MGEQLSAATLPALNGQLSTGIGCDCGILYQVAYEAHGLLTLDEIRERSWMPIVLECDCGARFRVLNGAVNQTREGKVK